MYRKIMVPVDLAHIERLDKAITTATDLAKHYQIPVCFVGVTAEAPTEVAHNPREYEDKLKAFAAEKGQAHGLETESAAYASHDPTVDLNRTLIDACSQCSADLIVMASHVPGMADHIFSSHAGTVATHADVSVMVVR